MIGLDARLQSYRAGGISEHIARLVEGFQAIGQADDLLVLRHRKPLVTSDYGPRGLASRVLFTPPHHRCENALLPLELMTAGLDLLHAPDTVLPRWWRRPGVITVHDVAFLRRPEIVTAESRRYYGQIHRSVRQAERIIVVSDYTRRELLALTAAPAEHVRVIPNALHPRFKPAGAAVGAPGASPPDRASDLAAARRYGLTGRFVLFVSTIEPRKNIGLLLAAFRRLVDDLPGRGDDDGLTLALVGADGWHSADVYAAARELGLLAAGDPLPRSVAETTDSAAPSDLDPHRSDGAAPPVSGGHGPASRGRGRARFLGFVPYDDLASLYRSAAVVAHPALDEGFGLTVLEAMACGAPTITSSTSSLPEVAGDAAVLVDPEDVEALGTAMVNVLSDQALRQRLRTRGFERARLFTWQRAAWRTSALYRELCA